MPVIRFSGNGLNSNTTSQQVSAPTTKDNKSVILDNTLQLDQKVRNLQGISQNIVLDTSQLNNNKNYLLTNKTYLVDTFMPQTGDVSIFQGSNYSVLTPKADTITIMGTQSSVLIFENIEFYSGKTNPILTIYEDSKVMFKNCVFRKENNIQNSTDRYVFSGANCQISFVGCWFCGTQTSGNVIYNLGVANDVSINGGFNTTTRNHFNTTIFGEQT